MKHSILDANCWAAYVKDEMEKNNGHGAQSYTHATKLGKIVFDSGDRIKAQYVQTTMGFGEQLFNVFFERITLSGRVHLEDVVGNSGIYKNLNKLGVPKGEHIYFQTAVKANVTFLVSEDIDFFDPCMKKTSSPAKQKCKLNGTGSVAKWAKKDHKINVLCMETYVAVQVNDEA